jgi:DNA-binding MarR family transcriptional regulator
MQEANREEIDRDDIEDPLPMIQASPAMEEEFPGSSVVATELILNLVALSDQIESYGEALMYEHGLPSSAAFNVLTIVLGAGEPLPPSVIAQRMVVSRQTITGVLDSLQKRGLIRRIPHAEDRRMTLIEVTPEGRKRAEALLPRLHAAERDGMSCLTLDEQKTLLRLIARLQRNIPPPGNPFD